jgi:hypothetical protein
VSAAREAPSPQRMIFRIRASCISDWTCAMIHARWMNELERVFRTPPDLVLGVSKKLELDSISIWQNGWGEKTSPNTKQRGSAQGAPGAFRGVLPYPNCFIERDGAFLPYCWCGHKSSWTTATAKPTPTLIRKVLFLFLLGGLEGRSALQQI